MERVTKKFNNVVFLEQIRIYYSVKLDIISIFMASEHVHHEVCESEIFGRQRRTFFIAYQFALCSWNIANTLFTIVVSSLKLYINTVLDQRFY